MKNKEFAFRLSKEKLMKVKDLSPEDKLDWLEEANEFVATFSLRKNRLIEEK